MGPLASSDPSFDFPGLLQESLALEQRSMQQLFSLSPLTSLEPSPVLGPASDRQLPMLDGSQLDLSVMPRMESKKATNHSKRQSHANRFKKRQHMKEREPFGSYASHYAISSKVRQRIGSQFKFKLVSWDGRASIPLIDNNGRIIGVLAGRPNDAGWEESCRAAADILENARGKLSFEKGDKKHRRGHFPALAVGISHGGGQVQPGVLDHSKGNNTVLRSILSTPAFIRIAGFGSSTFAAWAPRLYEYYSKNLQLLLDSGPGLYLNFANSVFACTTINFGPATACFKHKDHNNLPFGWCSITSLGEFDPKKSGHLVLWEPKLVIEFPPGSTVHIPSSTIAHSNTSISTGDGERRYLFTQYSAGGLFRWVQRGFVKDETYFKGLSDEHQEAEREEVARQLNTGLALFSNIKDFNISM